MTTPPSSAKLLGYFCVQAIRAQLYGMIGGRIHVVECILLLLGYCHMGGAWPEQMVDPLICSSEHDVSMCFSEHAGTLLMSWRSWPEPVSRVVDVLHRRVEEEGLLGVEYCLGGCGIGHGRLGPLSLGSGFLPPGSGFLPPGLGPCLRVPTPGSGSLPPGLGPASGF
ncbi:hypothetical protein F2Q70_00021610 [Brassica cretica]|uniref:Uncharacterized protein n=1 Tax=Brassica cretica TaxID=69181 RepID=A0A8S9GP07_BRACR|nr:hypothetical protein F2Q70_00021610 [Brassica cretica]